MGVAEKGVILGIAIKNCAIIMRNAINEGMCPRRDGVISPLKLIVGTDGPLHMRVCRP